LPVFYLHHLHKEVGGFESNTLEVIDGQQRLNALHKFKEGHSFDQLTPELQEKFLTTLLSTVRIETSIPNEARNLLIRLQAGLPLNPQKKRDTWLGNFTSFILKAAGKPELIGAPARALCKPHLVDRGSPR
jgi:hypothetical protein